MTIWLLLLVLTVIIGGALAVVCAALWCILIEDLEDD